MAELIDDAELLRMSIATNALSAVPVDVRNQARKSASDLALSHIKKRHGLPLLSWGDDVRRAVANIASYDILVFRGFNPQAGADTSIRDRYFESLQWLRDLAKGTVEAVDIVDSTPAVNERGPLVATSEGGPLWDDYGTTRRRRRGFNGV